MPEEDIDDTKFENEYIKMIKMMQVNKNDRVLKSDELLDAMDDMSADESDLEYSKKH